MMKAKPEKARDIKMAMKKLFSYMSHYKKSFIIVLIFAIGSTAAMIVGPKIMGQATTELFEGLVRKIRGLGDIDFTAIGKIVIGVLILYAVSSLFSYIQGWIMANISTDISFRLRKDISEKINRMPLKYFDGISQGEVLSRITNDVDTINQTLSQSITQLITSIVTVIGVLVMMFTINWLLALVSLAIIPLSMILLGIILKRSQKYFTRQQEYLGHVNGHVEEMYGGHLVVKSFNGEEKSIEKFGEYNGTLYKTAWKSQFFSTLMMPIMNFIGNLGYVVVAILGGWLAIQGSINIGDIQAFIQYVRSFTRPLGQLANVSSTLQQTGAAAERVFEFLDEDEEIAETKTPCQCEDKVGVVEFRNVKFGYSPDKIIIKNFSAIARRGQKIALVGPTGAGKTTMVKLLMRFYDVNDGAILVDNHDVREYSRENLRNTFGMVLQDTWLYNDTIRNNIRYGHPDATEEDIMRAAKAAHVDHFVHTLAGGYDMILNEEITNISQGQKQLLTIARAVLADPKILILDEATSSVDTRTELLIQKAMDNLMKDRTSFVIAHRLSTIRDADLILVMRDGDIVEQGNHEELLKRGGFYAELHNSQFEPEEEETISVLK
ncbi:ABC transporter ATP-binding protein [Promethearchaeum syntrophicum]|uniref:ABC transporter ATP-binding protein n=2 Tax=Promethearchaeum syntrophicum TaxID=2594042 RepID=A0A5B9DAV3_9ARCH|nr:ABC transporter ATP-binding protein [Candidatus Prometheoarchaeum syntrophicum]